MSIQSREPFFQNLSFDQSEAWAEAAREWNLDFQQLEGGNFRGELLQLGTGAALLTNVRLNRRFDQRGASPGGQRTFGVPAEGCSPFTFRGWGPSEDAVVIFPSGEEFGGVSNPGFHVFTLTFPEELLARRSQELGLPEFDDLIGGTAKVMTCSRVAMEELRRRLRRVCRKAANDPATLQNSWFRQEFDEEVSQALLTALASSREMPLKPSPRLRRRALERAEAYIAEFGTMPIRVRDLCRVTGVSERTLRYAFLERFGVSPKAYVQAIRLNHVRRVLRGAEPSSTKVSDVANRCGFWHMGQFAADYQKFFEELPSVTLKRRGNGRGCSVIGNP